MKKNMRIAYALILLIFTVFLLVSCMGNNEKSTPTDGQKLFVLDENGEVQKDGNGNDVEKKVVLLNSDGRKKVDSTAKYVVMAKTPDGKSTYVKEVLDESKTKIADTTTIVEIITVNGVEKYARFNEDGTRMTGVLYVEEDDYKDAKPDDNKYKKKWNEYILGPVGWLMTQINNLVKNYIVTLFIFAILVKILFLWFSIKQHKTTVKQAYFKPKEQAIRNKYKGRTDQATMQKMQQEIMDAQQKEGISAFGGCLPLLIQLPIIFLLYEVIRNPLTYVSAYGKQCIASLRHVIGYNDLTGWDLSMIAKNSRSAIASGAVGNFQELDMVPLLRQNFGAFSNVFGMGEKSASGLPNFFAFGKHVDLSFTPTFQTHGIYFLYLLIPVITFVTLFISMKINRKLTAGSAQVPAAEGQPDMRMAGGIMDLAMPLMSTVFTFMVPSLLGVYWIFNNLLGTLQQLILVKVFPYPVFTDEDYKKAEREYNKGKDVKKKVEKDPNRPKVRSLHHIDDDDDEDYPALPPIKEERSEEESVVPKAPLKKDDRKAGKNADRTEKTEKEDNKNNGDPDNQDSGN